MLALMLSLSSFAQRTEAFDAQPRDLIPAPPGTNLGLIYYNHENYNNYVDQNAHDVPNSKLTVDVIIPRYTRYFELGNIPAAFDIYLPVGGYSESQIGGADLSSKDFSLGDTALGLLLWSMSNPEEHQHLAFATYIILPTGEYHSGTDINFGANLWSIIFQSGIAVPLSERWSVELVADITIYGNNDDGPGGLTVEQDPSITALSWLNYLVAPGSTASFGLKTAQFGKKSTNNMSLGSGHSTRIRAAYSLMIKPSIQVLIQVDRDVSVENAFEKESGVLIRLSRFF